jgi:hypothetical protein
MKEFSFIPFFFFFEFTFLLFQNRIDINFLYSRANLWKYNGKKIENYMKEIITLVEDERVLSLE